MGEGKKIVVEHYPAERLPEDLRRALGSTAGQVRITVESETRGNGSSEAVTLAGMIGTGRGVYAEGEVVDAIRALRDEP